MRAGPRNSFPVEILSSAGTRRAASTAVLALGALLLACERSSGNRSTGDAEAIPTFVAADPIVQIGLIEGKPPYLLSGVSDATRQSDGTIVVADCMTAQVRYFDRSGRFLRVVGGRGQGPGEFGFLRRIFPLGGDTIGVDDARRITILAPDGSLARTVPFRTGGMDALGGLSDGSFVARRWDFGLLVDSMGDHRVATTLHLLDSAGRHLDSVPRLPAADAIAGPDPRRPSTAMRLRRTAVIAVHPGGIFYGGQDDAGVIEYDRGLNRVGVTTALTRAEPVTESARNAFQAMADRGAHRPPDDLTQGAPPPPGYAPVMPAFGDIVAGRDGRLWVQDPLRPGHYPLVWTAYEEGEPTARVELLPRFFPFEFGDDWVLGVSFGELTVERVELRPLVPAELSGRVLTPREAEPPVHNRCGVWTSR
jgi:6-bladed beta-propeller